MTVRCSECGASLLLGSGKEVDSDEEAVWTDVVTCSLCGEIYVLGEEDDE